MICIEYAPDGLKWAERLGGPDAFIARSEAHLAAIAACVERTFGSRSWLSIPPSAATLRFA
jgi:phosphoserine aminotransferase